MSVVHPEIVIVGGGVVGLSTALQLAERGVAVTLVDRQQAGREASWAVAAGCRSCALVARPPRDSFADAKSL